YHDRLSSEHDGFHTRSAYFIDNSAWYFVTNACTNSRLTGGCLAQVCRYHIPHHYLIYFLGIYSRTFERSFNGYRAKFCSRECGKPASKATYGCSYSGDYIRSEEHTSELQSRENLV